MDWGLSSFVASTVWFVFISAWFGVTFYKLDKLIRQLDDYKNQRKTDIIEAFRSLLSAPASISKYELKLDEEVFAIVNGNTEGEKCRHDFTPTIKAKR